LDGTTHNGKLEISARISIMTEYVPPVERFVLVCLAVATATLPILNIFSAIGKTFRGVVGGFSYFLFWILAASGVADKTTKDCESNDGGLGEKNPDRLSLWFFSINQSCLGRSDGAYYGTLVVSFGCCTQDERLSN
jgi:hypothetical protein